MRDVFYNVVKTHKPDKFQARLIDGRDHRHKLDINFRIVDHYNDMIKPGLAKFFQETIISQLKNQFDKVCEEMFNAIEGPTIDVEAGAETLARIALKADKENIKTILNDISKA